MALKKANISQHATFSSKNPQTIKRQSKSPKEHDGEYIDTHISTNISIL